MAVKVMIKRTVPADKVKELTPLLIQLRTLAMQRSTYISGETLKRIDNPGQYLVISTWQTLDDWRKWVLSEERTDIQRKVDDLLGEKTEYEVYTY